VRRKIYGLFVLGLLLITLSGCAGILGALGIEGGSGRRRNLANAVDMTKAGLDNEARHFLELVIDDTREEGVTDEALFRLAILQFNDGELGGGKSSLALLEKLKNNYPSSVWTRQSAPLHAYLTSSKHVRYRDRELNSLREKNLSLSRDVRDLRQTIERLKVLDFELEQKIRR
jgi:hypothetical protein